jgi:hypothetical protein
MSLTTLLQSVQKLQTALQAKAKAEPSYRFYSLWDKVCRKDVLWQAYRRCRANGGAPGVDRVTFEQIESECLGVWLAKLQEELRSKTYCPGPLLRVWIPKTGGQRPLGIPWIHNRVVQMALLLVIGPIFEADFCDDRRSPKQVLSGPFVPLVNSDPAPPQTTVGTVSHPRPARIFLRVATQQSGLACPGLHGSDRQAAAGTCCIHSATTQ